MVDLPEPHEWLVLFHRSSRWWVERIVPGPWKHVSALGLVVETKVWLWVSWELGRLRITTVPDDKIEAILVKQSDIGAVLRVKRAPFDTGPWRPRAGLFCTSMVAHLLGLRRGALFPRGLWRLLIAHGAEVVGNGRSHPGESGNADTDRSGEERSGRSGCRAA